MDPVARPGPQRLCLLADIGVGSFQREVTAAPTEPFPTLGDYLERHLEALFDAGSSHSDVEYRPES